jgi:hypothetical protein
MRIVTMGVMSVANEMIKSSKYYEQKGEATEIKNLVMQVLNNPTTCDWQLSSATTTQTLNTTSLNSSGSLNSEIKLTKIHAGANASSPTLIEASSPYSANGIKVDTITMKGLTPTGIANQYIGEMVVSFKDTARPLAPIKIKKIIQLEPVSPSNPATAQKVLACGASGETSEGYRASCIWYNSGTTPRCAPPTCQGADLDLGVSCDQTFSLWGGSNGYNGGNCSRECKPSFSSKRELRQVTCPWGGSNGVMNCTPDACTAGEIDKGTACFSGGSAVGGPNGTSWGKCVRYCYQNTL